MNPGCFVGRKFTPNEIVEMRCDRFHRGMTFEALCKKWKTGARSVRSIVYGWHYAECGGPISSPRKRAAYTKFTRKQSLQLAFAYLTGTSIKQLANAFDSDHQSVSKAIRRAGRELRKTFKYMEGIDG